jgi:hypothetical protein
MRKRPPGARVLERLRLVELQSRSRLTPAARSRLFSSPPSISCTTGPRTAAHRGAERPRWGEITEPQAGHVLEPLPSRANVVVLDQSLYPS